MTPGSAHLIVPGQIHSFSNTSNDFEIYILLFESSFLAQFNFAPLVLDNLLNIDIECNPKMNLDSHEFATWKNTFNLMNSELAQRNSLYAEIIATHIFNLLLLIKRKLLYNNLGTQNHTRQHEILTTFKHLIELNFQIKKTVKEYAQLMHISPKHLSETVKFLSNHSALYHIHERIIHESEYLLVYSNQSIKEISIALYFESPSLFSRFFKKHKGVSPLKFRASNN